MAPAGRSCWSPRSPPSWASGFSSAAVAELPRTRFATGSAVSATSRQIGAVVGIATLIALLGTPTAAGAVHTFHRAWLMMAATEAGAALVAAILGRVRARHVETAEQIGQSEAELSKSHAMLRRYWYGPRIARRGTS